MKKMILLWITLFSVLAQAETFQKEELENNEDFAVRIAPVDRHVTHKTATFKKWINSFPTIIAFYEQPAAADDLTGETNIDAVAYIGTSKTHFNKVVFDHYGSAGGNPSIESVFLSENKSDHRLIVIVSWDVNHAGVKGRLYETFIYARPDDANAEKLTYLAPLSREVSGGCDCYYEDGSEKVAKFKTAEEVLKVLNLDK